MEHRQVGQVYIKTGVVAASGIQYQFEVYLYKDVTMTVRFRLRNGTGASEIYISAAGITKGYCTWYCIPK